MLLGNKCYVCTKRGDNAHFKRMLITGTFTVAQCPIPAEFTAATLKLYL